MKLKKLFFLLAYFIVIVGAFADVPWPLNPVVTSSNGQIMISTPTNGGYQFEVWASNRVDSIPGTGSQLDPYDVSNQLKFDTVIYSTVQANTHIHLPPGVFLTAANTTGGVASANLKSGCWLEGSGRGLTTIKLSNLGATDTPTLVATLVNQNNPYTRVSRITFDGNATALSAGANRSINAVELDGDYVMIDDCEAINMWSDSATGKENFTFKIANWVQSTTSTGFTVAAGANTVPLTNTAIFTVGDTVRIQAVGGGANQCWLVITSINAGVSIVGTNQGFAGTVANGTVVASGAVVFDEHGVKGCKIVDCIERLHLGNYGSSFCAFSDYNKAQSVDMINCKCYDRVPTVTAVNGAFGFQGNQERGRIINGYAENCSHFFYCEGPAANIQILGGVARNLTCTAVRLNGQGGNLFSNIEVGSCDFEINNNVDPSGGNIKWAINFTAPTQGNISGIRVHDTSIKLKNTGATTTYGMLLAMSTQLEISNVNIDAGLVNNFDATNKNIFALFDNVTTPDGSFITLTGTNGLPATLNCRPGSDPAINANILVSFYTGAKLINPNSLTPSATNRETIIVYPGQYLFTDGQFVMDATASFFIDIVGKSTNPRDQLLTSPGKTLSYTVNDKQIRNFYITTTANGTISGSGDTTTAAALWHNAAATSAEWIDNCILDGAGTNNAIRGGKTFAGRYTNNEIKTGGFWGHGQGQLDGVVDRNRCTSATVSTNNFYIGSGKVRNSEFLAGLDLYRNDNIIENNYIFNSISNGNAVSEGNNGANGGICRRNTLISNGTGVAYKNTSGARSTAYYYNDSNADLDTSITNLIAPGQQYNTKDSTNITK